jgi:hypothetical protein
MGLQPKSLFDGGVAVYSNVGKARIGQDPRLRTADIKLLCSRKVQNHLAVPFQRRHPLFNSDSATTA